MVTHYFTLKALARELHPILSGALITDVFTQQRDELLVLFDVQTGTMAGSTPVLAVSVEPTMNYFFLRQEFSRAKKNSLNLFADLVGRTIVSVMIHHADRIIRIGLDNEWSVQLQLYNSVASNLVLLDEHAVVREAFKNNKELKGSRFESGRSIDVQELLNDAETFFKRLVETDQAQVLGALKKVYPVLGSLYATEALFRSSVDERTLMTNLDQPTMNLIHLNIRRIVEETDHLSAIVYSLHGKKKLSIIPLQHLAATESITHPTVNDAVRAMVVSTFREKGLDTLKGELWDKIKTLRERAERRIRKTLEHRGRDLPDYERLGKLLLANLSEVRKGMKKVAVPDVFGQGERIFIDLDPARSPVENAERFFEKARKARLALEESDRRKLELAAEIDSLGVLQRALEPTQSEREVKLFLHQYGEELRRLNIMTDTEEKDRPPFRMFTVAGGYEVWVGKSSANNDLLTMKFSRPYDLWFHVRGAGGSHTVLKIQSDGQPPPKQAIVQAAAIAAYYSKMRKAGNVPVAYCERKYVRKPKGLAEGAVILEREKIIFVKPGLPEKSSPTHDASP